MSPNRKPSYLNFDKDSYPWKAEVDYRRQPELYRVGKGEQGVLICQPYKSEILPHWHFKTPEIALESSKSIYKLFEQYLANDDFVGADMARKFLQMGFTRARRYANYKGGNKYDKEDSYALKERGSGDPLKAQSAAIFYKAWKDAEANEIYLVQKREWRSKHG